MAGVAFMPSLSCISWCSCRFIHAGLCIWGAQIHGRSCTWTHNTGSFMLLRQTAQCTAMTKQGSCALPNIPLACSMNAEPPCKTLPGFPYMHHTSQHTPRTLHTPRMQTDSPPQPPSTCPLATLRNHHPCQVQADPAILSATVRVSWSRVSCMAAATVEDLITEMRRV